MNVFETEPLEALAAYVIALDAAGAITSWNRACVELTGRTLAQVRGLGLGRVLASGGEAARIDETLGRLVASEGPRGFEVTAEAREGGPKVIAFSVASVDGARPGGPRWLLCGVDVTLANRAREADMVRLRGLLELASDGIFVADREGRYTDVNEAGCRLLRLKREEIVSRSIIDLIPAEDRERLWAVRQQLLRGEADVSEWRLRRADGSYVPVEVSARILPDGRWQGVVRDLTERLRLEGALRETNADLRRAQAVAKVGSWRLDLEQGEISWSAETYRIFDVPEGTSMTYETFLARVHPDDRGRVDQRWQAALRGEPYDLEHRIVVGDAVRWVRERAALECDDRGAARRAIGVVLDITEEVRSRQRIEALAVEAQRRAAEQEAVLQHMLDGVIFCDDQHRARLANQAALRQFSLGCIEDLGRDLRRWPGRLRARDAHGVPLGPEDVPLARALRGEVVEKEDCVITPVADGPEVWLRVSAAPVRDQEGRILGAVSVQRDVTDLVELDRLKDQFIRVAAHELKTPVTIIKGYAATLLRSGGALPAALRRTLDALGRGAERIDRIVTDLVDVSQIDLHRLELWREPVDLAELVQATVDRVNLSSEDRVRVVASLPLVAFIDRDRVGQVLTNLLRNAIQYSPAGGEVEVAVRRQGAMVEVSVTDHGVGIPRDRQARVFERFYRAHTDTPYDYGGMGVGLHLGRAIVMAHRGRMWFESEEGAGSTFHFALPLNGAPHHDV